MIRICQIAQNCHAPQRSTNFRPFGEKILWYKTYKVLRDENKISICIRERSPKVLALPTLDSLHFVLVRQRNNNQHNDARRRILTSLTKSSLARAYTTLKPDGVIYNTSDGNDPQRYVQTICVTHQGFIIEVLRVALRRCPYLGLPISQIRS
jgi:hypothetical protein